MEFKLALAVHKSPQIDFVIRHINPVQYAHSSFLKNSKRTVHPILSVFKSANSSEHPGF